MNNAYCSASIVKIPTNTLVKFYWFKYINEGGKNNSIFRYCLRCKLIINTLSVKGLNNLNSLSIREAKQKKILIHIL